MRWFGVLFLVLFLVGCSSDEPTEPNLTSGVNLVFARNMFVNHIRNSSPCLEHWVFEGWLINIGDTPANDVQARVNIYDSSDNLVLTVTDPVGSPIAPGDSSQVYFYTDWADNYDHFILGEVTWTQ